jgi:hypothetical protein
MSFILLFYFKVFKSCVKINYCKINVLDIKTGKESNFESFTTQLMCVSYPESLGYLFKRFSSLVSVLKFLLTKEHSNRKLANIFTPMAKSFNHKSNSYPNGPSHLPLQQQADDSLAGSFLVSLWVSALAGVNKKVIDAKLMDL